jgi:hypothetical protein
MFTQVTTLPRELFGNREALRGKGFRALDGLFRTTAGDDGFDRFFPIGLTWSATRFTVTVRNHPRRWTPRAAGPHVGWKVRPHDARFPGSQGFNRPLVPSRAVDDESEPGGRNDAV